jgi:hypothetical protein
VDLLENIPQGRLNQSKMACIKDLLESKLFCLEDCRGILLPQFCHQIKEKLENKEEVSHLKNTAITNQKSIKHGFLIFLLNVCYCLIKI